MAKFIGSKVQKNYNYGCKYGERKLVIFDVKKDGLYQNHLYDDRFCKRHNLIHAPIEYIGAYPGNEALKEKWVDGKSTLCPSQQIREGIVIKPFIEQHCFMGPPWTWIACST